MGTLGNLGGSDYELQVVSTVCFQETATPANKWTRSVVVPLINGVAQTPVTYWTNESTGATSTVAPVPATEPCPPASGDDNEVTILCDDNGAFLRRYTVDFAGTVTSSDTLLDGTTAYVVVGTVRNCSDPTEKAVQPLCDDNGAFLRCFVLDNQGNLTVTDTLLDGVTPYVTVGSVAVCVRTEHEIVVLCDDNGAFLQRYNLDGAGGLTVTTTLLDGVTAYVPVGTIVQCTEPAQLDREIQQLCDDNGPFLRRYNIDGAGVVTTNDTLLNGVTAYVTVGTVVACAADTTDYELFLLCDDNGSFLRRYTIAAGVVTITNTQLDGTTAYVPVGTVVACTVDTTDYEFHLLCDDNGSFLRRYTIDGGVVTITNTQLDGTTAYVPVGTVVACAADSTDYELVLLCDDNGSFLRRYTVDAGVVTITNTQLDGTTAYVPVGTVSECAAADHELVTLCDDNGPFLRRYNVDGGTVTTTDTLLDGTTAYVTVGTVEACPLPPAVYKTVCMCDDVNGDGTNIVNYVDVYEVTGQIGGPITSTLLESYTDETLQVVYVPTNAVECDALGSDIKGVRPQATELTGGVWVKPALAQSVTFSAVNVADSSAPPTVVTDAGTLSLQEGQVLSWSVVTGTGSEVLVGTLNVSAGPADIIHIHYTELVV